MLGSAQFSTRRRMPSPGLAKLSHWQPGSGARDGSADAAGRPARMTRARRSDGRLRVIFTSIPARQIDLVGDRQPGLEAADRLADDRRGGWRMGLGGDMRGEDDPRMDPERVLG